MFTVFATFASGGGMRLPGVSKLSDGVLRFKAQRIALHEYSRLVACFVFALRAIFDPVVAGQRSNFGKNEVFSSSTSRDNSDARRVPWTICSILTYN